MKRKIVFALLFIFVFSLNGCIKKQSHVTSLPIETEAIRSEAETAEFSVPATIKSLDDDGYEDVTYVVNSSLHNDMPEYRFVATGKIRSTKEWEMGFVMGLEAFDENGTSILSKDFSFISGDRIVGSYVYNQMMDTMGLHIVDVNFDGYKDIIILESFSGAHSNTWYYCWLWNPETASFEESESFLEICNPALDPEKKCIYSAGGSGAGYWGGHIYKYIDGEFIMTNDLYTGIYGLTETELIGGKMEIIREISFERDMEMIIEDELSSMSILDDEIVDAEREYYKNHELWHLNHPRWYWYGGHHADPWLEE